jgi:hypothetical protein
MTPFSYFSLFKKNISAYGAVLCFVFVFYSGSGFASQCLSSPLRADRNSTIETRILCEGESVVTLTRSLFRRGFVEGRVESVNLQQNTFVVSVEGRGRFSMNYGASLRDIKTGFASNLEGTVHVGDNVRYVDNDFPYSRISLTELMDHLRHQESPQWQTGVVEKIFRNPHAANPVSARVQEDAPLYLIRASDGQLKWRHITDRTTYLVGGYVIYAGRQIDVRGRRDIDFGTISMQSNGQEDIISRCQHICDTTDGCQAYTVIVDTSLLGAIDRMLGQNLRSQCQLKRFYHLPHGQPANLNFSRMTWLYDQASFTGIRVLRQ